MKMNKKCKGTARIITGVDGIQRYVCDCCCPEGLTITELLAKALDTTKEDAIKTAMVMSHMLNIGLDEAIKRLIASHL